RFEPQRIARAETSRADALLQQRVPQRRRIARRTVDLPAVLTGVAGVRHQRGATGDLAFRERKARQLDERQCREARQHLGGTRALQGEQGVVVAAVDHVRPAHVRAQMREIALAIRGVDAEEEAISSAPVHDDVVDDTAAGGQQQRVLGLSVRQAADVVGGHILAGRQCAGAAHLDLAHVADVKQTGPRTHHLVLADDARVLHRHLPAGEVDHARTELAVLLVQRRTLHRTAPAAVADPTARASAAVTVFLSSMAMVIGPTPPGTGVMCAARPRARSNSTSPISLPSAPRFVPTSITTAPGLIQSPRTSCALPIAATRTSAPPTSAARSRVREWQIVTVAWRSSSRKAAGLPTRLLRPTTVARAPLSSTPVLSSRRMMPSGVHGRRPGCPATRRA